MAWLGYDSSNSSRESLSDGVDLGEGLSPPGSVSSDPGTEASGDQADETAIQARAYQLEMLEESLNQNTIVTMDTGSGKTQVAVLRIQAELERSPGKIIWFLAPTVTLCEQQFHVLQTQIPAVQIKFLSGAHGIDTWSRKAVWDACLKHVGIVVCPYQVLFDALSHAFVQMDTISLIVFDEAHNCVGKAPGSKIMMSYYHEHKKAGLSVPTILGLTASPVVNTSVEKLEMIEATLDAVCKTPTKHRAELVAQVKRPAMSYVVYGPKTSHYEPGILTPSMISLQEALSRLNIMEDPYVLHLMAENTERSLVALKNALEKENTFVHVQMKSLFRKSVEVRCELGWWAADYFISKAITQFTESVTDPRYWAQNKDEKVYLASILGKVNHAQPSGDIQVSKKVVKLIEVLLAHADNVVGIVFVRETVTASLLTYILSVHPLTRGLIRVGSMCGTSSIAARRQNVGELQRGGDEKNLRDFRLGKLNLLIATSVLEEGIDVPACNLVVCFDKPGNLKSFIQRRGRAREHASRLILLMDEESEDQQAAFEYLEEEMRRKYEDEMRQLQEINSLEETNEDIAPYYVPQTGAKLDPDQAKGHLEHFCESLAYHPWMRCRPYYVLHKVENSRNEPPQVRATVVLPNSLPQRLRRIDSANVWYSSEKANKDAAFQAYVELHKAGLVNDHLIPLEGEASPPGSETRPSVVPVNPLTSPWPLVALAWGESSHMELYRRPLRVVDQSQDIVLEIDLLLPVPIPDIPDFHCYWDATPWTVVVGPLSQVPAPAHNQTMALINLAYGYRFPVKEDTRNILQFSNSETLTFGQCGAQPVVSELLRPQSSDFPCLIRGPQGRPFYFHRWLDSRPPIECVKKFEKGLFEEAIHSPWLALRKWPRRQDFLHPISLPGSDQGVPSSKLYDYILPAHTCTVDTVDVRNVQIGSLIPSIMHMVEIHFLVHELSNTVLRDVAIRDKSLLLTAISAPAARETTDYERLEFLGDSVLKLLASVNVSVKFPEFPEGYLTKMKDKIVSNARLCRSAIDTGLDKFIISTAFAGAKWRPIDIDQALQAHREGALNESEKRNMSTKVLADVVEAVIGASYLDGGISKTLDCLRLFMPEISWLDLENSRRVLNPKAFDPQVLDPQRSLPTPLPDHLLPLEALIGYQFTNKELLIEAVTHASYNTGSYSCMERHEFLGDAILDAVVVNLLWGENLEHQEMHLLRTAVVNADMLGFLALEWTVAQEATDIVDAEVVPSHADLPFWSFMRHASPDMSKLQQAVRERHAAAREPLLAALQTGASYPWPQLAALNVPKFFCDLFESVLGAVWLDSGSMDQCHAMAERAGIVRYLRRFLADGVDVVHPKNKLGMKAGSKRVRYEVVVPLRGGAKEEGEEEEEEGLVCRAYVDDELLAEVGGGVTRDEVRTKAAEVAYNVLLDRELDRMEA